MKRVLMLLLLGTCVHLVKASQADAQCHYECTAIYDIDGHLLGFGCLWYVDAFTTCAPTKRMCFIGGCSEAFVNNADGAMLAEADICRDKVTLRNLSPARVAKSSAKTAHASKRPGLGRASPRLPVSA